MTAQVGPSPLDEAEALIDVIGEVFPDGPPPKPGDLVLDVGDRDRASASETRDALAGVSWRSLPETWIRDSWASTCYLTPGAFRYYLPALLRSGLLAVPGPGASHVHSVTYALKPSMWAIHWRGFDAVHEARVAALSPAQFDVVCAFLDLVHRTRHEFPAAEAMRWGWSQRETPHHAAVKAHYERMFSWERPPPEDATAAELAGYVTAAFDDVEYPGDDELCGSRQGDEPALYALEFRGQDWRTLHPEFLAYNSAATSFFTPAAFRYYLPAFLLDALGASESDFDPVFAFAGAVANPYDSLHTFDRERLDPLTRPQVEAIVACLRLEHERDLYDINRKDIDRALEAYWLPRLI